jgi:microcystin-dependent protein
MHANSADVGGNNTPVTGGAYNPDGLTVADVLGTAVVATAAAATAAAAVTTPAATTTAVAAAPAPQVAASAVNDAPAAAVASADAATAGGATDHQHFSLPEMAQHFHHMWG